MKNVQKIDLGLTGYDELFANDEERKVNKLPRIFDIPISEIDDFPDHPFKVKIDEDMDQLVQSIKERGIITPVTLRPKEDGRYEIVSGHRRKKACEIAGLDTVKAEVREMSRDEAIILMVESNLQRSTILPSEKAFSYKMRLEAMNRQGQRTDLTSTPVVSKSRSNEELGSEHKFLQSHNGGPAMNNTIIQKGDIFYANLGETVGSEQSGIRPVLVIQNNVGNKYSPTLIITPLTSKAKKLAQPTHVIIGKSFGLTEYSYALLEQIRTIDRARLLEYVGHVDESVMVKVDDALRVSLNLR